MVARISTLLAASRYWRPALVGLAGLCAAVGLCLFAASTARADYDEWIPDPPTIRDWNRARTCEQSSDPKKMLRAEADWNALVFDAYFNNILFPQFTIYKEKDGSPGGNVLMMENPKNAAQRIPGSELPLAREQFIHQFINQAQVNPNLEPFNHLNQITIQAMLKIVRGNYHPLSRYNAAMLLTNLHELNQPEKPLRTTLPALMACLDSIDVVRVAALEGLLKHAKAGSVGAEQPQLVDAMLKILKEKAPPAGRTTDGNDWMRRRAIDILAALGDPGPNLVVIAELNKILKDNQSSLEMSCSAAKALGSISFHAPDAMNAAATAYSIGQIAVDAYKAELARAEERFEKAQPARCRAGNNLPGVGPRPPIASAGGGLLGGGAAAGAAVAAAPERELFVSIPLLRSQLYALDRGMKGLVAATTGTKNQQFAESVEKNLDLLMKSCDPNAADYETLKAGITKAGSGWKPHWPQERPTPAPRPRPGTGKARCREQRRFVRLRRQNRRRRLQSMADPVGRSRRICGLRKRICNRGAAVATT